MTDLGYTWIGNNASGAPNTSASMISNGIMGSQWKAGSGESGMANESVRTNDTMKSPVGEGTVTPRGADWR